MELKNCLKCQRTFGARDNEEYCSKCSMDHIEEDFKKVRDYLYDYPGADIKEVAQATGVSERTIIKLLKDERIEVVEDSNALLKCERCTVGIKSGRYCDECKNDIEKELIATRESLKSQPDLKAKDKETIKTAIRSTRRDR